MNYLQGIQPEDVFSAFEKLSSIPHGSYNVKKICDYIEDYARSLRLECRRDASDNLLIVREASEGYEKCPTIIVQGHTDMVCVKKAGCTLDMERDPISLKVEGDWLSADGTSLGADDGIALAFSMALMKTDKPHPRIEFLLTANEEVGMLGMEAADLSSLRGRYLMNVDSGMQGTFIVSSASGLELACRFPGAFSEAFGTLCTVRLYGLHGGHSGSQIHIGYRNAVLLLNSVVSESFQDTPIRLVSVSGGSKSNVIPSECTFSFLVPENTDITKLRRALEKAVAGVKPLEPDARFDIALEHDQTVSALSAEDTASMLKCLREFPDGVLAESRSFEDTVETSSNLGSCATKDDSVTFTFLVRSLCPGGAEAVAEKIQAAAAAHGGDCRTISFYGPWPFSEDNTLCEVMKKAYRSLTGEEPLTKALHAGLECGTVVMKRPDIRCVSFGPTMEYIHSADERLSISSTKFTWELILETMKDFISLTE